MPYIIVQKALTDDTEQEPLKAKAASTELQQSAAKDFPVIIQ